MRGTRPEYQAKQPPPPVVTAFRPRETLSRNRQVPIETSLREADEIFRACETGKWKRADPRHFVALYWRLHETVHGVEPIELQDRRTWNLACVEASVMLSQHFRGDREMFAHYISWVWAKEHEAVHRRRSSWRTTWKQQFSSKLLGDYMAAMVRGRAAAERAGYR